MAEYSAKSYLADDEMRITDVESDTYPDGHTYSVAAPSAADELLMRRMVQLQEDVEEIQTTPPEADETPEQLAARDAGLAAARTERADLMTRLCVDPDGNKITFAEKVLGAAHAQMTADGVRERYIEKFASLVMTNYAVGEHVAALVVAQAAGEALARAQRAAEPTPTKSAASQRPVGSSSKPTSGEGRTRSTRTSTPKRSTAAKRAPRPARKTA